MKITIGIKYLIINIQIGFDLAKKGEPDSISLAAFSAPHTQPTKIESKNAPRASEKSPQRKLICPRKSAEDKRSGRIENSVKKSEDPCERAEGIPMMYVTKATIQTIFFRFTLFSSTIYATGTSNREIVDVSAATDSNIKKNAPTMNPPGICVNSFGKTTNTSEGPAEGLSPIANSAGKIINPAIIAITVSNRPIKKAEDIKFSFLDT